jgi:hypothetical protein
LTKANFKILTGSPGELEPKIDLLGMDGWDIVSVTPLEGERGTADVSIVLKRPFVPELPPPVGALSQPRRS